MTKLGVSNSDFSNLNLGSVEIDTESFSFSPVDKTQSFEQNSEVSFEEMDVSSDLSSSSEKNEIVKKLSILLNECQIEISDLYSKRDTLNKQLQQTKDIYSKTEIGKKINDINKKIIDIKNKYEDKVKYLLLIESINEKIQEVENDNKELLNKQSNTLDIYSKTEIGKVINSNNEKIKEYQMIINIYSELENDTTNGTELLDLLKSKYNKYLESNDSYKAETYFYLYYAELEEQLKNSTGSKLEKLQNEYNENFNIENIYEQYVNCKIKIHDEEGSLEDLNEELKQIEFKASLLGYDIAEAYKQQKEYEAEQKRIESERIQAEYERQKKLDEENKNPFLFLWHMYEDSDLYKNSYKMGGRIWEHQMDIAQSKDINEFLQKTNEAYVDIKNTTLATISQIPIKAWVGIEKAAEGIVDGCTIIGSGVISLGTFAVEYINGGMAKTDGFKFTEELIKNTQEFVGKDWIGNAEKWFYSTDLGKAIDETALIQHNSAEAQFISGIGEATFNIMTGGALAGATGLSAKTAMIATSGIKGMGIGYQNATIDGADAQSAALYGTASGSWEMLQWAVGAQINTYAANGFKAAGTNTAKVLGTLALSTSLDSIDAGVEGFVQPALQMIYKDSDYLTLFEQNGGFQSVIKQAAIGGVMSLATSIGDAEKSFKTAKEIDVQVDKKTLTETLRDKLDLSGLKQEDFVLDKKGNRIIPNYEKPQVNLQERIRNLAKAIVGELELSGGMLGLFLAPELSPICLPAMLDGGIRFSDVITNNSIKDSLFIVNKNHKSNIWGYTDRISQTAKLKDALTLSLTNDKIGAFSIQGMNMFTQLQKSRNGIDITYSTHSQPQTAAFLKMLEKEGYIKDLVRADGGKQSLAFEKLMFGNTDNLFKKEQMYEMSFKLTDKKFDINAMNEIIAKRHIDTSNYTLKTIMQNGEKLQIFVPNTSKIFKEATGAQLEKIKSLINNLYDNIKNKKEITNNSMNTNDFFDKSDLSGLKQTDFNIEKTAIDLKTEILSTIDNNMSTIEKARKLYIELNKRVNYDMNITGTNEQVFREYYNKVNNFEDLVKRNNRLVCKGWAQLYYELLIDSGFDPNKVKIIETAKQEHAWVQIELDDGKIMICDATETQRGGFDISNSKFGKKLYGQCIFPKELDGRRLSKINEEIIDLKFKNEEIGRIDEQYNLTKDSNLDITITLDITEQLEITEKLPDLETENSSIKEISTDSINVYNYSELISKKSELMNDILVKINKEMSDLDKSRIIYKELEQRLNFDTPIDTRVWSELYAELLINSGIDTKNIKTVVSPTDDHMWVELTLDSKYVLKTDITVKSSDNQVLNLTPNDGQLITYYNNRSILEELELKQKISSSTSLFQEIDNNIGYRLDMYLEDVLSLSTKNKLEAIYNELNGNDIKINLINQDFPKNFDGLDFYYYIKNVTDALSPHLLDLPINNLEIEPLAWTIQDGKYIAYSKSIGKQVFDNYQTLTEYLKEIGAHEHRK